MSDSSFVQILRDRAQQMPGARSYTFLTGGEEAESLTFGGLDERARAIGARLRRLGARGERTLLLYPPGTEYISAFYGCLTAAAVAVPAYPPRMNRNLQRLESILQDATPRFVLTTEAVFRQMRRHFEDSPHLAQLEWVITDQIPNEESREWVDPNVTQDTLAFLQYTSASTSRPKGVMVSHRNLLHNQILMKKAVQHGRDTVSVSWLPLFHDMGLISVVFASLYNGFPCHLMSPVDFLKRPRVWLEAITRYRATFSGAPDFGFQLCVDRINPQEREGLDLSQWRVAYNGSEPVRAATLRRFAQAFAPCGFRSQAIFPCYGLAEHTLFVSGRFFEGTQAFSRTSLEQHQPRLATSGECAYLVSCGTPSQDVRIRIVNPHTQTQCPDGQAGEIWLASPSVASGYWNQRAASDRDLRAQTENGDGPYLRTGDLGFLHNDQLYITGRIKDLIIIRGRNLVPQDIEQTVELCDDAMRPAFVAAVSVEAGGAERLVIVGEVRREIRRTIDTAALMARIRSAVANDYEVEVSAVVLLRPGSLPKTSSGKTQRAKVRRDFQADALEVIAEWRDDVVRKPAKRGSTTKRWLPAQVEDWLVRRIAAHAKLPPTKVDLDLAVFSFGLDSVVAAALSCEIEDTFGIDWELDKLFGSEPTVRQIARQILAQTQTENDVVPRSQGANVVPEKAVAAGSSGSNGGNGFARSSAPSPDQLILSSGAKTIAKPAGHSAAPLGVRKLTALPAGGATSGNGNGTHRVHAFRTSVNPELGRTLAQMAMDKTFVRGEGSWLWDETGRRYLDFLAQYGALPFGFNPPRIWAALNAVQASGEPSFVQPSFLNAAGELAQRLLAAAPPGMSYVTFANSGAEAIEAAIKLCQSTTGRRAILSATNGFHGKTLGALSATDKEKYQKPFGAPVKGFDYVPYGNLDALRRALATKRYAGFLVEPVQGEGGIVEPPAGYLRSARKACRETGTLFVADEIQTGIGRTGVMFVCCELGITPDVMTVAKALGGGLVPIGACLSTAAAYNPDFALKHTSTFAGNTLACRAGLATLDLIEENDGALLKKVKENGTRLKERLEDLKQRFPKLISEVRGRGYLLGIRFGLDRYSVAEGLLGYLGEQEAFTFLIVGHLLHFEGVRVGCTLNQGGILRIEPPLTATWEQCEFFLAALERVLALLEKGDVAALTAQVSGLELPAAVLRESSPLRQETALAARRPAHRHPAPSSGDGRFAFLVHPLAWKDYANLDHSLSALSTEQLATLSSAFADNFDPFVIGETRVVGRNGKTAYGEFILVPRRAEELKAMPPEKALEEIRQAVGLGKKRGARIIGLGGYTSIVTQGGLSLKGHDLPALTTGNSYTAIASRETIRLAAAARGWRLPMRTVGILGAGGAIGQALSILMSQDVGRLVLLGNPAHREESLQRLLQVAGRIVWSAEELARSGALAQGSVASWVRELGFALPAKPDRTNLIKLGEELIRRTRSVQISVDADMSLPEVDIVVCCTSTTDQLVRDESLSHSAVVCDVSRPSNLSAELVDRRPDVMVLNGGVVRLPGDAALGFNASLDPGLAYACMAETIMLALEQRYQDISLGFDLSLSQVLEVGQLAGELNFQVVLDHKKRGGREDDVVANTFAKSVGLGTAWMPSPGLF